MKKLTLLLLILSLVMVGCGNRRIQVMDTYDGKMLTVVDNKVIGGIGDTLVIAVPQERISGRVPSIYGKYIGKLPANKTVIRAGNKYTISYIKAVRVR